MYPRFLQVKKQPPLSGSVFIAYIRPVYMCTHTRARAHARRGRLANKHIHTHVHTYIPLENEMGKKIAYRLETTCAFTFTKSPDAVLL